MNGGEEEEGKEEREQELQLLYAIITALGLAWPTNRDTQVREGGGVLVQCTYVALLL